jgi:hypothetical protein
MLVAVNQNDIMIHRGKSISTNFKDFFSDHVSKLAIFALIRGLARLAYFQYQSSA